MDLKVIKCFVIPDLFEQSNASTRAKSETDSVNQSLKLYHFAFMNRPVGVSDTAIVPVYDSRIIVYAHIPIPKPPSPAPVSPFVVSSIDAH